jgi:hypothetical protein
MSRNRTLASTICILLAIGTAVAGLAASTPARAQYPYLCPPGYYFYPGYGCYPPGYFAGPPFFAYPDFGFGLFYGGERGGYRGHGGGAVPHGGAPHGAGPHGGGGQGGGGHGGGHAGR